MRYGYDIDGRVNQTVGQDELTIDGDYFTTGDFTFPAGFESNPFDYKYENGALTLEPMVILMSIERLRAVRDELLAESDWRDLPSYPGSDQVAWRTYRQELRDITAGYTPVVESSIVYPTQP